MTFPENQDTDRSEFHLQPASSGEPHWYAAYTRGNHERRVAAELAVKGVEHFLPLYSSVRRWSDRRVRLDFPLFPGYVFVRLAMTDKLHVVRVNGVVRLVGFNGRPAALPDEEMEILCSGLTRAPRAEPHPYLTAGRRVRMKSGPLAGLEGILLRRKSGLRVVVSVHMIQRSVSVDADAVDVEPLFGN